MKVIKQISIISLLLISSFPAAKVFGQTFESQYTPVVRCKTISQIKAPKEAPEHGGKTTDLCPGLEGYKVYNISEHIHNYLMLEKGKEKIKLFPESKLVNVPILAGDKLEWRYKNENGTKKLIAWIYRVAGEDLNDPSKIKKPLQVIRLEAQNRKWCLLGETNTNEEAQKIADSDKGCGGVTPFGLY